MTQQQRVAIITGSGRGIGQSIARRLAREGARVMLCSRTETELAETAASIAKEGGVAQFTVTDLARQEDCQRLIDETVRRFGRLDILVNNAADPGPQVSLHECSLEQWEATLRIDLTAVFLCCKAALLHMRAQGFGRIINISSGAGAHPMANSGPYGVAKSGVNLLTRILSQENAPYGITVNGITPGLVLTPMILRNLDKASQISGVPGEQFLKMSLKMPHLTHLERPAEAEEVSNTVAFLASDGASAITGDIINHMGGWVAG